MKKLKVVLMATAIVASAFVFTGCDKDDDDDNSTPKTYELSGNASGSQMEPSNSSTATGTITGTYDSSTNVLNYTISWQNLSSTPTTAGFFSKVTGAADITISAVLSLGTSPAAASGSSSGSVTLSADQETKFLANQWYYIVRSNTYASGEIRGQVHAAVKK